ncbi:hypothetical protein [Halochromatium glycolicum]|nr:hypothetical protein [Halochromatium glycolicum]
MPLGGLKFGNRLNLIRLLGSLLAESLAELPDESQAGSGSASLRLGRIFLGLRLPLCAHERQAHGLAGLMLEMKQVRKKPDTGSIATRRISSCQVSSSARLSRRGAMVVASAARYS